MTKTNGKKQKQNKKMKKPKAMSNHNPDFFFNREFSWLEFNYRVLNEALDKRNPLLERVRFLTIYISNLDEFVMKRVGGLKSQAESEYSYLSIDGKAPEKQLEIIRNMILKTNDDHEKGFMSIKRELAENDILLLDWNDLTPDEKNECNDYFLKNIYPVLTPLSVDPGKPFPFLSDLSYSFGLYLKGGINQDRVFSRVKVPDSVHEWIRLSSDVKGYRMINTAEIIKNNLGHLYPGMTIECVMPFRITRNADWEHADEDTEDLLVLIEESINSRRLQEPIRMECLTDYNDEMMDYLLEELNLKESDVYVNDYTIDFLSLDSIANLNIPKLKFPEWRPMTIASFQRQNIFEAIREKDHYVHHPYDNFNTSVEKFITEASEDPQVLSIKMTLYRTGDNSPFIRALINAAENGKQVVCLIELKARFDEKRNIYWAKKMEEAGVHVVYGIVGLKTHTKIAQVVRKESSGELLQYVHISTGNYNSKTAKLYTDMGIFTIDKRITGEVMEVFNYLTGSSLKIDYKELLVSPVTAKSRFLQLIQDQTKYALNGDEQVEIIAKMNSFEDIAIAQALYKASQAGVKITMIVRGFCCLRPGIEGLSDNIKVLSVIGRFLEHSRVFYFKSAKNENLYIGSADWMHRNMHSRVEVITPIYSKEIIVKVKKFLSILINDKRNAWDLGVDGTYKQRNGSEKTATHNSMMDLYSSED